MMKQNSLFVSYVKPHKAVSGDTISRRTKETLKLCGVDIKVLAAHNNNNKNFILPEVHINITVLNRSNKGYWLHEITLELKCQAASYKKRFILHVQVGHTNKQKREE